MNKSYILKTNSDTYNQYFATVEETLAGGENVRLAFGGTSMHPTLGANDKLTFAPVDSRKLKVGEVVLFRHDGMYKVHRIIRIRGGRITLQGDNCYGVEHAVPEDIVAKLVSVDRIGSTDGPEWDALSRKSLKRKKVKNFFIRWFGSQGRHQLRPWYLFALFFLMWAPLNGVGPVLNNYIMGIRGDHLMHATVFIPCALFFIDLSRHRWLVWVMCIALALLCEGVQYLLPFRKFDVNDLVANTIGVTLGFVAILLALRAVHKRRQYPDLATP